MPSDTLIACPKCGAKNRIPADKLDLAPKCGRCHESLKAEIDRQQSVVLTLRCSQCHTKNRVPQVKLHAGAKCGRCGTPIEHEGILDGRTVMVTDATFDRTVLQSPLPVLLYGWAPWCSVCSGTGPQVEQMAAETRGKVRVAKVNIDTSPQVASKYDILSVPAFFIFDGGALKEHLPGAVPKHELMMKMAHYI
jgi:thioredoxin 2